MSEISNEVEQPCGSCGTQGEHDCDPGGGEEMFELEHFPESKHKILKLIQKAVNNPRNGEPYEGQGASAETGKAGRHPVKADTTVALTLFAEQRRAEVGRPLHIVEYGVAFLVSGSYLLFGAPDSKYTGYEFGEDVAEEARGNLNEAGVDNLIVAGLVENNIDVLKQLPPIDILTVDHNKASYLPDTIAALPYMAEGGLILGDNVNDRRAECQDFVDYFTENYGAEILPTQAGLLVARV